MVYILLTWYLMSIFSNDAAFAFYRQKWIPIMTPWIPWRDCFTVSWWLFRWSGSRVWWLGVCTDKRQLFVFVYVWLLMYLVIVGCFIVFGVFAVWFWWRLCLWLLFCGVCYRVIVYVVFIWCYCLVVDDGWLSWMFVRLWYFHVGV